ncbi:MAG: hypothetical protein ACXAB7_01315 [Candidatus Kariarchaeaceae archaeon]|jgi:hypothetical protein
MELSKVEPKNYEMIIQKTLKTLVSDDEYEDIKDGLYLEFKEGGYLFSLDDEANNVGFIVASPINDEDFVGEEISVLSVDEIYIQSGTQIPIVAETVARGLQRLRKEFKCKHIEIIISEPLSWMGDILQENGYICVEVKLEKVLPTPNNLADVLELIRDCTPIDRIVQVLLEKNNEFRAEILEDVEEIEEQLEDDWVPVIVVVTYEPESLKVSDILEKSNQIIKWDNFSLIYKGE